MLLGHWHANHFGGTRHAQLHLLGRGHVGLDIGNRATGGVGGAANLQHQRGNALNDLDRVGRIDTALKTVPGIGREIKAARAASHGLGPPKRRFNVDVLRAIRHRRGIAPHDAGQRFQAIGIGNHPHLPIHRDGAAVQQLELLTGLPPAHLQAAVDFVEVKNMRRLAQLKHHVVGNIHQRRHRALATTRQAINHPLRRFDLGIDTAHDAAGKAATQVRRLNLYRQTVWVPHTGVRKFKRRQGGASVSADNSRATP